MSIIKRSDIIPILYYGGTGGNFLATFLYHAREGNTNWKFSRYGNAHSCKHDTGSHWQTAEVNAIYYLIPILKIPVTRTVRYINTHCPAPDLAMKFFNKVIKTYFNDNDVEEISLAFVAKCVVDEQHQSIEKQIEYIKYFRSKIARVPNLCNKYHESSDILNISWQELVHIDPSIMIIKLSKFTELPYEMFPIDQLLEWRRLTLQGIIEYRSILSS